MFYGIKVIFLTVVYKSASYEYTSTVFYSGSIFSVLNASFIGPRL